jgi:hypothetical protein
VSYQSCVVICGLSVKVASSLMSARRGKRIVAGMYTSRWTIMSEAWSNPVSRADRWAVLVISLLMLVAFVAITAALVAASGLT